VKHGRRHRRPAKVVYPRLLRQKVWHRIHEWRRSPRAAAVYVLTTIALFVWGHQSQMKNYFSQAESALHLGHRCAQEDVKQAHDSLPLLYTRLLQWTSRPAHKDITIVYIPQELTAVQQNVCTARSYLADVLTAIDHEHPALVVIDKYFGASSCVPDDPNTRKLITAIRRLPFPVVAGISSHAAPKDLESTGACLVEDAVIPGFTAPRLSFGLLRPNADLAKIPLQWKSAKPDDPSPAVSSRDTLALRAFSEFAPEMESSSDFQQILAADRAPYASLQGDILGETTSDLLCSQRDANITSGPQGGDDGCHRNLITHPLLGRVVLLAAQSENDKATVLGHTFWGYELQAYYLNALLTGSFLLAPPLFPVLLTYLVYFLLNGMLFPPDGYSRASSTSAWMTSTALRLTALALLTLAFTAAFLLFHCLPPLGAFLLCFPVVVTQLLLQLQEGSHGHIVGGGKPGKQDKDSRQDQTISPTASLPQNTTRTPPSPSQETA
jgi:CHASE2 domain-containing sensor protein